MRIRILALGQRAETLNLDDGTSVRDALDKAEIDLAGKSISVNGVGCDLATTVQDGDVIVASPKVAGGR